MRENEETDEDSDVHDFDEPTPSRSAKQISLPQDKVISELYEEGLVSITNTVCFKVMKKYPEYVSSDTPVGMRGPTWAYSFRNKGQAPANFNLMEMAKNMDKMFQSMHGSGVDKDGNVVKRFREAVVQKHPYIEPEVATAFGQVRLQCRIRALNTRDRYVQEKKREERRINKQEVAKRREAREKRSQTAKRKPAKRAASKSGTRSSSQKRTLPKQSRSYKKNKQYVS